MTRKLLASLASLLAVCASPLGAQPIPTAAETHPGVRVEPTLLTAADGTKLRAVVTTPQGGWARRPGILFVPWLSCDSVAIPAANLDGWQKMLQRLVRDSGAVVWRTDKRGVGGSEGRCDRLDYLTELADHKAALEALRRRPDVDPARIFIFGASMGSNMAPLLAQDQDVAGVIVWGGGARTWAERTLGFERNRLELGDGPPADRASEITLRYRVVERLLIAREPPSAFAAREPALADAWRRFAGVSEAGLYGRPLEFHWQAQQQNWPAAWARVNAPVLALFGEYDWFEDAAGVALIGDIVNQRAPGRAQVAIVPGLDHHFQRFATRREAFAGRGGVDAPEAVMDILLPWLREQAAR